MFFSSWLRQPNAKPRISRRAASTFRPRLEVLEGREVPSTLKVTNLLDSGPGSLRCEIAQAISGDTIVFDHKLGGQTITLTSGELVISKSLTIKGQGETITSQKWVDASLTNHNGSRIFEVDGAGTTVAISGLTLRNGGGIHVPGQGWAYDGDGGAILNFGTLTVSGCTLSGNAGLNGGGIYNSRIFGGGTLTVSGCTLSGNAATGNGSGANTGTALDYGYGGGIYNDVGTLTVSGCTLSGNAAYSGGGIYSAGAAGALTVLDSIFSSNTPDSVYGAYTDGGGNTFK